MSLHIFFCVAVSTDSTLERRHARALLRETPNNEGQNWRAILNDDRRKRLTEAEQGGRQDR